MKIHAILHASFETVGSIEGWALENGHSLSLTHSYLGELLPGVGDIDFLIVMGGPQSPREGDIYPYLVEEMKLIRDAIRAKKLVLGICLGAQLIGEALGARTMRSPEKEIGVWPITLTEEGRGDPLFESFGSTFDVMHWHNDMPGIPEGGVLLAGSVGCPHQAIRYGEGVYGFQFHMEITGEGAKAMCEHCPGDLRASRFTQAEGDLLGSDLAGINEKLEIILDRLIKK